ncbi:MAG: XamI family restriction endonuclease [Nitrospiraceae bacterium]|nr:XamI family restriction endonuclease [Nitrospiraceae bacterium]
MPINSDKPHLWKADVAQSIDFYNDWFLRFAPATYRRQRVIRTKDVLAAFEKTDNLTEITPDVLRDAPGILPILRMVTSPPLARDRLIGLAYLNKAMVGAMEGGDDKAPRLPVRMNERMLKEGLERICEIVDELADHDLLPWLASGEKPTKADLDRGATVVADRLCGATSDPIIRNAQEKRQLAAIGRWLRRNGYRRIETEEARDLGEMPAGTFTFHLTIPAGRPKNAVNIPIDCVVKPLDAPQGTLPVLIEAKSAGDATNTNKRRKEEADKFSKLRDRYGKSVQFILLLCGYFEPGYLGYEASEGIDWVWEHRLDDLRALFSIGRKKKVSGVEEEPGVFDSLEERRYKLQLNVDAAKTQAERNILGQFSTPYPLALQIVERALIELSPSESFTFLEPALGSGVFFSALKVKAGGRTIRQATGVEQDRVYADIAQKLYGTKGLNVLLQDFIEFAATTDNRGRFNLLCTNPPYVRHHHLESALKLQLQSRVLSSLGLKVSGLAGLYVYFVLLADSLLAANGVASWLIPSEFLYVNYGKPLRDYLARHVTLLNIHQFNPETVQFDDALVSSCVVTYKKKQPDAETSFVFSYGGSITQPEETKTINLSGRDSAQKWGLLHFGQEELSQDADALGDFFDVRRGIATGANEFFIIGTATIKEYSIPWQFLKPMLPSPRYVTQGVIEADADGLPQIDNLKYLLDCNLPPNVVRDRYPGMWTYLQKGKKQGLHERYLCASKEVWYFQEKRAPSLFMATYMGRSSGNGQAPIRFFLNYSKAIGTNVFLHLYPKPALMKLLQEKPERMKELLDLMNGIPMQEFLRVGRAYGGGLHKVEPGELKNLSLGQLPEWMQGVVGKQMVLI